jgi:hypothetical protein
MDGLGYYLSSRGFRGPFWSVSDVKAGRPLELAGVNLYCIKKQLVDAKGGPNSRQGGPLAGLGAAGRPSVLLSGWRPGQNVATG